MARVAVLGTGIMGGPIARNLLRVGHKVSVWNRTEEKARALEDDGAQVGRSSADAVTGAEIVDHHARGCASRGGRHGGMDMPYAHLKGEMILKGKFPPSFPVRLARKDAALILEAAGDIDLPLARATSAKFDRAFELGHCDEDMSAIYYASAEKAGSRS